MEVWKNVPGYEEKYQVSTWGNVRSLPYTTARGTYRPGSIVAQRTDKDGYKIVTLNFLGKRKDFKVHRLVALAFIPNPNCLPEINHKDEIKNNNNVFNLEWCTTKYNLNYGTRPKRISEAHKGVPKPWCQGERNYFYGKRFCGADNVTSKKVDQFDLEGTFIARFDCINEAAKKSGAHPSAISMVCRGKRNKANGYKWAYAS